ncbi:hypothetical protein J5N97_026520 [Dioscorea zingiberensis]|uniref:Ribosome biogenesis protein slx9-like n=1 Tax=Dioscorea zingiberensis TaxID=325984 RepID=A0A9D5C3P1_9LILI|nr:hypothetical protein J5N97_026520 [Dioscorea zingiberensis]
MGLTGLRPSSGRKEKSKSSKTKLEKKLHFFEKVKDSAGSLNAKKSIGKKTKLRSRKKKLKAYDLSSLSEFLPDLDASQKQTKGTNFKLNSKSRLKLVQKESVQLKAVLNHPTFQADPIAAIHQYLERTQPPADQEKQAGKTKKAKKKGAKKKSSGSEAMVI